MEGKALKRYIPSSPLKMRIVVDQIRGKKANDALNILRFTPKMAAKDAELVLRSAIANLTKKAEISEISINDDEIYVKEVFVDQGASMKRILPAPMGRAFRMKKRSNHLTIIVATPETEENNLIKE
ncbi:MAG TPA: 50S ribosomal protein L22 [Candidatus Kapabacteria bacterium]|nr:50S ribosomal protein L22 [Candidatus Kapabacteria bacterium]